MAFALIGAADRPRVTLMTALPLVWGEGDAADILQGRSGRSETLAIIETKFDVRPIDILSKKTLGRDIVIIAQPRRLMPTELVAFDKWMQRGGRAIIFADPELMWPSRYPLGDNRRAPPVELLDPLFAHWGVALGDSDRQARMVSINGTAVKLLAAGAWTGPKNCAVVVPEVLDCRIGKGRVLLVGDADMLDPRVWTPDGADNAAWIVDQLHLLGGSDPRGPTRLSGTVVGGLIAAASATATLIYHHFGGT
jgi:ABC-type uncharacterized transport system